MDKTDVIVLTIVWSIIAFVAYGIVTSEPVYETTIIESVNIYSVSLHGDSKFTLGSFMSGSGESYFNYYYFKDYGNGKILDSVPTSNTVIIETDDEVPTLERYKTLFYHTFYSGKSSFKVVYYNKLTVPTNTTQLTFHAEI